MFLVPQLVDLFERINPRFFSPVVLIPYPIHLVYIYDTIH
jgi:hypothetical protein